MELIFSYGVQLLLMCGDLLTATFIDKICHYITHIQEKTANLICTGLHEKELEQCKE
jgi:hypothetical protein